MNYPILLMLLFLSPLVTARVLTWKESIELTVQNNAELKSSMASLEATQFQEKVVRSEFLPEFHANLDLTRNRKEAPGSFLSAKNTPQSQSQYAFSLSGSWNLFAGFKDKEKIQEAKAKTNLASVNWQLLKAKVSYELKSSYQGFLYALEYKKLTQDIIRRREENLRLVELRFESGRENKGSVFLSQAYLQQAKYDDLQAENAKKLAEAQLKKILGLDDFPYELAENKIPLQALAGERPDFHELVLQSPEYFQASYQEEAASAAIKIAQSTYYPTLDFSGSINQTDRGFFPDEKNHWAVKLGVSFPLFNGGRDFYQIQSAVSSWTAAKRSFEHNRRQQLTKLQEAYVNYQESEQKLAMYESFLKATLIRAEIARKKYNNGLVDFEDWDIIENDLISRQKLLLQGQRDRVVAEASWEQTQGKGVIP